MLTKTPQTPTGGTRAGSRDRITPAQHASSPRHGITQRKRIRGKRISQPTGSQAHGQACPHAIRPAHQQAHPISQAPPAARPTATPPAGPPHQQTHGQACPRQTGARQHGQPRQGVILDMRIAYTVLRPWHGPRIGADWTLYHGRGWVEIRPARRKPGPFPAMQKRQAKKSPHCAGFFGRFEWCGFIRSNLPNAQCRHHQQPGRDNARPIDRIPSH